MQITPEELGEIIVSAMRESQNVNMLETPSPLKPPTRNEYIETLEKRVERLADYHNTTKKDNKYLLSILTKIFISLKHSAFPPELTDTMLELESIIAKELAEKIKKGL